MTLFNFRKSTVTQYLIIFCCTLFIATSCTNDTSDSENDFEVLNPDESATPNPDEDSGTEEEPDENSGSNCTDVASFIFQESNGMVKIEFENAVFEEDWQLRTDGGNFSGDGYMVWTGPQHLRGPESNAIRYTINIENPGTYQFVWRSAVTIGNNGTDHNDTWLRFADADDFFGQKGDEVVYPRGTGKTPNPEGDSTDGWFKIYRSGNDLDFKWQSKTSDNGGFNVFVTFNESGNYVMEVAARSSGNAIDQFLLFQEPLTQNEATASSIFSEIDCN